MSSGIQVSGSVARAGPRIKYTDYDFALQTACRRPVGRSCGSTHMALTTATGNAPLHHARSEVRWIDDNFRDKRSVAVFVDVMKFHAVRPEVLHGRMCHVIRCDLLL